MALPTLSLLLLSSLAVLSTHLTAGTNAELTWSKKAAELAEAVAAKNCSGHGRAYVDGVLGGDGLPVCECDKCFSGSTCETFNSSCLADAVVGDQILFEPYFKSHAESSSVLVSGWHRMSYQADGPNLMVREVKRHIRLLHKAVNNAVVDGKFIALGAGSINLLNAAVHALSLDSAPSPVGVVARVPYYPAFRTQTRFFESPRYVWKGDALDFVNSTEPLIEFVTSPSNPENFIQKAVVAGSHKISDHVYYWPHFTPMTGPLDDDLMLFSLSKLSGLSGSRFGWAVIRNETIYRRVVSYLSNNMSGVSRDAQVVALNVLKTVLNGANKVDGDDMFYFGYKQLSRRWSRLSEVVKDSDRFSVQTLSPDLCNYFKKVNDPSPSYAWLKCEKEADCKKVVTDGGIDVQEGSRFGANDTHVRLSLVRDQANFDLMLDRLKRLG